MRLTNKSIVISSLGDSKCDATIPSNDLFLRSFQTQNLVVFFTPLHHINQSPIIILYHDVIRLSYRMKIFMEINFSDMAQTGQNHGI